MDINAVPGNFHIEARSGEGLSINPRTANLSHVVHYFHVSQSVSRAGDVFLLLSATSYEQVVFVCMCMCTNVSWYR